MLQVHIEPQKRGKIPNLACVTVITAIFWPVNPYRRVCEVEKNSLYLSNVISVT